MLTARQIAEAVLDGSYVPAAPSATKSVERKICEFCTRPFWRAADGPAREREKYCQPCR
jgi:hypothetical protein